MKSVEAIGVLNLFLTLSELIQTCSLCHFSLLFSPEELKGVLEKPTVDDEQVFNCLTSLQALHQTHLSPSSPSLIPLTPDPSPSLAAALSPSLSPAQRWACLRDSRVVQRLYHQVFQLLEDTYYPHYCQSQQVRVSFPYSHSPYPHSCLPLSSILDTWFNSQMGSKVARSEDTPLVWNEPMKRGVAELPSSPPPL